MNQQKKFKIAIIVLSTLLVLSAGGLAAQLIVLKFDAPRQTTVTVPDNLIGDQNTEWTTDSKMESIQNQVMEMIPKKSSDSTPSDESRPADSGVQSSEKISDSAAEGPKAAKLELYQGKPGANEKFEVRNLFPGDSITKYFCVKAYHDTDITLFFQAKVTEQTKSLGDVLHIKVTQIENGTVLCDAAFSEVKDKEFSAALKANPGHETTAFYQVEVSLASSVGNDYQAAWLKADFDWFVKEEGGLVPSPQTGVTLRIFLWVMAAASSLIMIAVLIRRRRKEDAQHGTAE